MEELDPILDDLRGEGFELPRTAAAYLDDWVKAGFLVRRSPHGTREELYELSTDCLTAIDFVRNLAAPRRSVSKSRLATVTEAVAALAMATDPDDATVLRQLEEEKAKLERHIERVRERGVDVISNPEALERAEEILALVADVPADFARVRSEVEHIDQSLRERILSEDQAAAEVLANVFRGVDLIQDSEAGKAFSGFYELLFDREQSARFDAYLQRILSRDFVEELTEAQRDRLQWLVRDLESDSDEVHASMLGLSRSLRRFVQSREAEAEQALSRALTETRRLAVEVGRTVNPSRSIGMEIELTSHPVTSVGSWRLHDPEEYRIETEMAACDAEVVDLAALVARVRASEIDYEELKHNVNDTLEVLAEPSVGEVLELHQATQGLASVVGLLKLALLYGCRGEGTEDLRWKSAGGTARRARVDVYRFTGPFVVSGSRISERISARKD